MFILIADDEKMIRLSLQSMLEELYPEEHMYMHAINGKATVEQVKKLPPDLVFLDIRMPLMNGLEVLEACQEISSSIKWVILSGYAEFEYAQKAINLSAYSYLLKPVDLVTLKNLVDNIIELKQKETELNNRLFTSDIIRTFHLADQLETDEMSFLPYGRANYIIYHIYIDRQEKERQYFLKDILFQKLNQFCVRNDFIIYHAIFFNTNGELCIVCSVKDNSHLNFFINSQIKNFPEDSISVFKANSDSLTEIYKLSQSIEKISDIRLIYDCRTAINIKSLVSLPELDEYLSFCNNINQFIQNTLIENRETIRQLSVKFEQDTHMSSIFNHINRGIFYLYLKDIFNYDFTAENFKTFIKELYQTASDFCSEKPLRNFDIDVIKDFVHQNYAKDVGISYVSEYFNLSPTYFSRIFHEKTGQKYIDFVTEVRMENAKKLIRKFPDITVKKTAEAVGYTSVRHFSKLFQKYTGVLPSNY
ncbi:MAG: response regulator [Lachnospiraceae bacterium]|jgi:two-component system response regulator YesN|nr:response regulator [Lachnospiraceae bacterium]MCI9325032.1 response regulator [Lachnospiraceae bacterium]